MPLAASVNTGPRWTNWIDISGQGPFSSIRQPGETLVTSVKYSVVSNLTSSFDVLIRYQDEGRLRLLRDVGPGQTTFRIGGNRVESRQTPVKIEIRFRSHSVPIRIAYTVIGRSLQRPRKSSDLIVSRSRLRPAQRWHRA